MYVTAGYLEGHIAGASWEHLMDNSGEIARFTAPLKPALKPMAFVKVRGT